jgi:hypothetical protein
MASPSRALSVELTSDWTSDRAYRALLGADPSAFAWEWLRRTEHYGLAWHAHLANSAAAAPQTFGLERFEDPALPVPVARPVWSAETSRDVLRARVSNPFAAASERVDLRLLSNFVTVAIGEDEIEHLLLSDGRHFLRIDVVVGTLIGVPAALTYLLHGISGLKGPMGALDRLAALVANSRFLTAGSTAVRRHHRWIAELRTADALAAGADQQNIARALYGSAISPLHWRTESAPYRRRIQRLVANAHARIRHPLRPWF